MDDKPIDPYRVLGLRPGATLLEIARARRRLAKRVHPDVAGTEPASDEEMRRVNAAWEALSDPDIRRAYAEAARPAWDRAAPPAWTARYAATSSPGPGSGPLARSGGRGGWVALAGVSLLLAAILVAGLVAALDGPAMPGRVSPVVQDNLDQPGQR